MCMKDLIMKNFFVFFCLIAMPLSALGEPAWLTDFKQDVSAVYHSDKWELYMPVHTWHNRAMYDKNKTDDYWERPYGGGLGKYIIDEKGNQHSLYGMFFLDSHANWQPIAGYAWEKKWYLDEMGDLRFGAGFTAFLTAREDYYYVPFPAALPLASIEYKNFAVQSTYIPGYYNFGNVLFTWVKWKF